MDLQTPEAVRAGQPTIVAVTMGYGHLRPAHSLAEFLGCPVLNADRAPLADAQERRTWDTTRLFYDGISRVSSTAVIGTPFRGLLDAITAIPSLHPFRDLSPATLPVHLLGQLSRRGLGRSLVAYLEEHDSPLVATFYSPAIFADYHGYDRIYCVVTDSDVQRVWAPANPGQSKIHYFAPSGRVVRRLRAYGVPKDQVDFTGFPLPHSLVGGPGDERLKEHLRRRLGRLDPKGVFRRQYAAELEQLGPLGGDDAPPHLVFAVGGAGAQADLPATFLPSLAPLLRAGQLRLTLVAGIKSEVAALFERQLRAASLTSTLGKSVSILVEDDVLQYFARFNELLATTDVLWTKPSELTFYGGLGIALLLAPPVGRHEIYNQRWAMENGAGLPQRDPRVAVGWLGEWLADGTLAAAAWAGYKRLPHRGLYRIVDRVLGHESVGRHTVAPPL